MAFEIKKVRPMFTSVITTATRYKGDQLTESGGLLIDTRKMDGTMNPIQRVIAVGNHVQGVNVGDVVKINFMRYTKSRHVPGKIEDNVQSDNMSAFVEIPFIEINGQQCLHIQNNDIEYVIEDYDVDEGGLFQ